MATEAIARNPKPGKNYCLSFFEALACICIIFIHIGFPGDFGIVMHSLGRFGVPLFFLISGFFLYKEGMTENDVRTKIRKRAPKILYLLILSFSIYLVLYTLLAEFRTGGQGGVNYLKRSFSWQNIVYFFIFCKPFVNGKNWFLIAMLWSYLFIFLFPKLFCKNKWFVYVLSLFTLFWYPFRLVCIITKPVLFGVELTKPFMYLSWFNNALLFISIGVVLKKNVSRIMKLSNKLILICLFSSVALMITEFFLMKKLLHTNTSYCFGNITCVMSMIALSVKNPNWFSKLKILQLDGQWTTYVYIFHPMFIDLIKLVFDHINWNATLERWIMPILVILISVPFSILFVRLLGKIKKQIAKKKEAKA